jgi:hypothetical protein
MVIIRYADTGVGLKCQFLQSKVFGSCNGKRLHRGEIVAVGGPEITIQSGLPWIM